MFRKLYDRIRALWNAALREHASPRETAWSVAIGVFVGCTPLLGFHMWIAMALATVFRLNRLWALVGSRISMFILLPWIILAEVQTAHRLRTGAWASLKARDAIDHANEYLLDWCVGAVPVGLVLASSLGMSAYFLVKRREARVTTRTPAPPRAPSSESPR